MKPEEMEVGKTGENTTYRSGPLGDPERMPTHAVKYPGMPWTLDFSGDLIKADVVGMRVARLVEGEGREYQHCLAMEDYGACKYDDTDIDLDKYPPMCGLCDWNVSGVWFAAPASQEDDTATLGASAISDIPPKVDPAGNAHCEATRAECVMCMTGECREEGRG